MDEPDPPSHAETLLQRGLQLHQLGRDADAEACFGEVVAIEPENAWAVYLMALSQFRQGNRAGEALRTVERAIALGPNESRHFALKAMICADLKKESESLSAAGEAVALNPSSSQGFSAKALAHFNVGHWPEAEKAAREALALDPDDSLAGQVLSHSLRLQNKRIDNREHLELMLGRDPEDDGAHNAAGWAALQSGDRAGAQEHFVEALRINPGNETAREGLLTVFRARSPLFRGYLGYCFRMQRLSTGMRWAVIIGLYFGVKFSGILFTGSMKTLGLMLASLYFIFCLWVHLAPGLGNLLLMTDRFARHALRKMERWDGLFVGGGVLTGVVGLGVGLWLHLPLVSILGTTSLAAAVPWAYTFTNPNKWGRRLFAAIGVLAWVAGLLLALSSLHPVEPISILANLLAWIAFFGVIASTWLSNLSALTK